MSAVGRTGTVATVAKRPVAACRALQKPTFADFSERRQPASRRLRRRPTGKRSIVGLPFVDEVIQWTGHGARLMRNRGQPVPATLRVLGIHG